MHPPAPKPSVCDRAQSTTVACVTAVALPSGPLRPLSQMPTGCSYGTVPYSYDVVPCRLLIPCFRLFSAEGCDMGMQEPAYRGKLRFWGSSAVSGRTSCLTGARAPSAFDLALPSVGALGVGSTQEDAHTHRVSGEFCGPSCYPRSRQHAELRESSQSVSGFWQYQVPRRPGLNLPCCRSKDLQPSILRLGALGRSLHLKVLWLFPVMRCTFT